MGYIFENSQEKEANRAFVLEEQNLVRLFDMGKKWVEQNKEGEGKPLVHCVALLRNCPDVIDGDTLSPILDCSNNKKQEITMILINLKMGEECEYSVRIQRNSHFPTLLCKVLGKNSEEAEKVYDGVTAEIKEMNQWYSVLSNRCIMGKLRVVSKWISRVVLSLLLILLVVSLYALHKDKSSAVSKIMVLEKVKEELKTFDPNVASKQRIEEVARLEQKIDNRLRYFHQLDGFTIVFGLGRFVLLAIVSYIMFRGVDRFLIYLYPRGVILIGAEVKRHEKLLTIRKYVFNACIAICVTVVGAVIVRAIVG